MFNYFLPLKIESKLLALYMFLQRCLLQNDSPIQLNHILNYVLKHIFFETPIEV